MGVAVKEDEPTGWVNLMVMVEKPNGKLRMCLDPGPLNKAIKREHFEMPTERQKKQTEEQKKPWLTLHAQPCSQSLMHPHPYSQHSAHHLVDTDSHGYHLEYTQPVTYFRRKLLK